MLRVLIVDDEHLARMRLAQLVAEISDPKACVVDMADSGQRAMQLLQEKQVDVVLLDIHMPGMDGIAVANLLLQKPEPPAVVFVTAHAEHALRACARRIAARAGTPLGQ